MQIEFGFVFVKSLFVPEDDNFVRSMAAYTRALEDLGGELWSLDSVDDPRPILYFMTTGGTEQVLMDTRQRRKGVAPDEPALIIAHPTQNSLPASLEVLARLQQDGAEGQVLYLRSPDDQAGLSKITDTLTNYRVSTALKDSRIGMLGKPSDWLVASSPGIDTVRATWGPEVIPVPLDELKELIKAIPESDVPPVRDDLIQGAVGIKEPSPAEIDDVVKVYLALKQVIGDHDLDALTLRCFDLVLGLNTTGCFGLSQLTDEGIISGCEGDLVSTVGLLWVKELLGLTPWMANPAQLDEANNQLLLAHCTVPKSIVQDYALRSHFESGKGVGIQGRLANGPVTLLRIGGKQMKKLWLAEGEIVEAGDSEDLCRTQARIKLNTGGISDLLESPLGNHIVMVQGHHLKRLHDWWRLMIDK